MAAVRDALAGRPIRQPDPSLRPPVIMPEPSADLAGWRVLVTAGGTAEPIDPVRYIGNRSTGRMGVAIAEAALGRGAQVTLVHGLTSVALPEGAALVAAPTAAEMRSAVLDALDDCDVLVMAAAVADFRPRTSATTKIARAGSGLTLELEPTSDILAEAVSLVRDRAPRPVMVGFAAETGSLDRARDKAARKGVDLLVANDVAEQGSGFGTETNRVTIVAPGRADEAVAADEQAPGRRAAARPHRRASSLQRSRSRCRIGGQMSAQTPRHRSADRRRHHQACYADGQRFAMLTATTTRPRACSTRPASRSSSSATRWHPSCWATTARSA